MKFITKALALIALLVSCLPSFAAMTAAQLTALKQAIDAETDPAFVALRQANETGQMAEYYNVATTFVVWRGTTPADDVLNAINWANLTPSDAPDATVIYTNRAEVCLSKQANLQILLQGRQIVATGKLNIQNGLRDALTGVPSGAGGALLDAGWLGAGRVKAIISRFATRAERIFATGTGSSANPGFLGSFEGTVTNNDILDALAR